MIRGAENAQRDPGSIKRSMENDNSRYWRKKKLGKKIPISNWVQRSQTWGPCCLHWVNMLSKVGVFSVYFSRVNIVYIRAVYIKHVTFFKYGNLQSSHIISFTNTGDSLFDALNNILPVKYWGAVMYEMVDKSSYPHAIPFCFWERTTTDVPTREDCVDQFRTYQTQESFIEQEKGR